MKATGIVRKMDHLGRLVIPVELRRIMKIGEYDPIEIFTDGDKIILRKYDTQGDMIQLLESVERGIETMDPLMHPNTRLALLAKLNEMKGIIEVSP